MRPGFDLELFLVSLIVIIISIALHEFGHAISADRLGDPTPRRDGRVTLWPDKHFDPIGFIMILMTTWFGFGIGWGKPVMVDDRYFRHPRRDMLIVSAFGPFMNLLLALFFGLILRLLISTGNVEMLIDPNSDAMTLFGQLTTTGKFLFSFVTINLSLMFFNLLPIHPLDGGKILSSLLPERTAAQYDRFMWQWGPIILLVAIMSGTGVIGMLIGPMIRKSFDLILGNF